MFAGCIGAQAGNVLETEKIAEELGQKYLAVLPFGAFSDKELRKTGTGLGSQVRPFLPHRLLLLRTTQCLTH
jgi:hypothetical protein